MSYGNRIIAKCFFPFFCFMLLGQVLKSATTVYVAMPSKLDGTVLADGQTGAVIQKRIADIIGQISYNGSKPAFNVTTKKDSSFQIIIETIADNRIWNSISQQNTSTDQE